MAINERRNHSVSTRREVNVPRVLIISNNCFSRTDSNGRTLQNFFVGWPEENLAQFYLQNSTPDFSVCRNFFRVTDGQALRAFLGKGTRGGIVTEEAVQSAPSSSGSGKKHQRTALTMLLRELVWNSRRWYSAEFQTWLDEFAPQVVLLQAGDCGFMFRLAEYIARKYRASLVVYNSEAYYFKSFDYFQGKGIAHWCYPLFRRQFCRQFRKTIHQAERSIYICDLLQRDYDREFGLPSEVIYTATGMQRAEKRDSKTGFTVSYLGNLGVGRHEPLVEIANALQEISPELHLDVYGKIPNETVKTAFNGCMGIRYKGFVSYEQVTKVMQNSDLLVHCENFSDFYREDLKYAFSTKIADSLACGSCFLLYAPEEMACTRYLTGNQAAWVASCAEDLKKTLRLLAECPEERARYLKQAVALTEKNHRAEQNARRFQEILCEAWEKHL